IRLQKGRYASRASGSTEDKIYQLLRWLKDHFTEHIEWHALAHRFDLPIRTLYRHIKRSTGCTPQRYLTKLRLSEAYFRLGHTEHSVTMIAHDCGFNDSTYFSTCFKHEFQITPSELRKAH